MKYLFVFLCALLIGQAQVRAQYGNPLNIKKGSLVFFKLSREMKAPAIYQVQVPLFIIGKVVSIKGSHVEVKPQSYLYTCSKSSEKWIQTSKMVFEKQSYERKVMATETWNASTQTNFFKKIFHLRPYKHSVIEILTRNRFAPAESCPKVIAVNKYRTR